MKTITLLDGRIARWDEDYEILVVSGTDEAIDDEKALFDTMLNMQTRFENEREELKRELIIRAGLERELRTTENYLATTREHCDGFRIACETRDAELTALKNGVLKDAFDFVTNSLDDDVFYPTDAAELEAKLRPIVIGQ